MASFTRRSSGWWQARVRRKGHPTVSKTFRTKAAAQDWAKSIEVDMDRALYVPTASAEQYTLGDVLSHYVEFYAPHHYRPNENGRETWRFVCARLADRLGDYSLASIDQVLVSRYRDWRLRNTSPSTVRRDLFMLSKVLRYAESEMGVILPRGNVAAKVTKPRENKARDRRLSAEEWSRLMEACRASRNKSLYPIVELATETAMRQGELLGLLWTNVRLDRQVAILPLTKNGESRAVPLSSAAVRILEGIPRPGPDKKDQRVFPMPRVTLSRAFNRARDRAGIPDFRFHDLRHEALSRLGERGDLNVIEISAVSGHKTLQVLKRYTHLHAEALARKLG